MKKETLIYSDFIKETEEAKKIEAEKKARREQEEALKNEGSEKILKKIEREI